MVAIKFEINPGKKLRFEEGFACLVELPRPSALRKRLIHFPFEIIWDTKVF
jgi:hypothetical protein